MMFFSKRCLHLLIVLTFLNFGCSHTHRMSNQSPSNFADKKVRIFLVGRSEFITAYHVQVATDSVSYIETKTKMKRNVAITDVIEVIKVNHLKGAGEGLIIGLLTGLAMVGVSAAISASKEDPIEGEKLWVGYGIVAGAGFTLLSTILGAAGGSRDIYIFNKKDKAPNASKK